jgi:toxin YoeB
MKVLFTENAWSSFEYWIESDPQMVLKIKEIIASIQRTPFSGLGKPEPLKYDLKGYWSRRISGEHRLVYSISGIGRDQICTIVQCRFHY